MDLLGLAERLLRNDHLSESEREIVAGVLRRAAPRRRGRPRDEHLWVRRWAAAFLAERLIQYGGWKAEAARMEIADTLNVSEATIKADLREVERVGLDWLTYQILDDERFRQALTLLSRASRG